MHTQVCLTAMDGRNTSGFVPLFSMPSADPTSPSCLFIRSMPPPGVPGSAVGGGTLPIPQAPKLLPPTPYTTCSENCCACCGEESCACANATGVHCCFSLYARSGQDYSLILRAQDDNEHQGVTLNISFPDGIDPSVQYAGLPNPQLLQQKYGCSASVNFVMTLPYTKSVFENSDKISRFRAAVLAAARGTSGSDSDSISALTDQDITDVTAAPAPDNGGHVLVDVVLEATRHADQSVSALMLHRQVAERLTQARLDAALVDQGLATSVNMPLNVTIDNFSRSRYRNSNGQLRLIDVDEDYDACVSNSKAADPLTLNGGVQKSST